MTLKDGFAERRPLVTAFLLSAFFPQIFLVLGVMSALQTGMALFFPNSVHGISEMSASCYRIEVRVSTVFRTRHLPSPTHLLHMFTRFC